MSQEEQKIIDKLQEMKETNEPVWVTFYGMRLKLRPMVEDDNFYPCQDALYKYKGGLHVATLCNKDGLRVWSGLHYLPDPRGNFLQPKHILAMVEEVHPRLD